jgi:hypothetical protein
VANIKTHLLCSSVSYSLYYVHSLFFSLTLTLNLSLIFILHLPRTKTGREVLLISQKVNLKSFITQIFLGGMDPFSSR